MTIAKIHDPATPMFFVMSERIVESVSWTVPPSPVMLSRMPW